MGDNMNAHTVLYQLKEESPYMMSFVVITKENNAIVIDDGKDFDIEKIYYHFPPYSIIDQAVDDPGFFRQELNEMLPPFDQRLSINSSTSTMVPVWRAFSAAKTRM